MEGKNKTNTKEEKTYTDKSGHKRKLTIKQRKFVDEVVKTGNATEAVKKVYNKTTEGSARAIGSENLSKPNIKAEIEDRLKVAKDIIYGLAMTAEKEEVRLRASQDIIDRGEGKPIQKVEQKVSGGLEIKTLPDEIKNKIIERLATLD